MSYALRNTIILLVVLAIMAGSGWAYIHFYQDNKIVHLSKELKSKQQKLKQDQTLANGYDQALDRYASEKIKLANYDKMLPLSLDASKLYGYLNEIRTDGSQMDLNFTVAGQTNDKKDEYGFLQVNISGNGSYRNLFNLIRTLEYSSAINKVNNIVITPTQKGNDYNNVTFTFELDSYYSTSKADHKMPEKIVHPTQRMSRDPFFPFIRSVKPNTLDLPNVEKSQLVGIGHNVIYLVDQNGKVQQLHLGDKVYLGSLVKVDLKDKSATFYLNKGGIFDKVVLTVK